MYPSSYQCAAKQTTLVADHLWRIFTPIFKNRNVFHQNMSAFPKRRSRQAEVDVPGQMLRATVQRRGMGFPLVL